MEKFLVSINCTATITNHQASIIKRTICIAIGGNITKKKEPNIQLLKRYIFMHLSWVL